MDLGLFLLLFRNQASKSLEESCKNGKRQEIPSVFLSEILESAQELQIYRMCYSDILYTDRETNTLQIICRASFK